jgi:hypothetical protein
MGQSWFFERVKKINKLKLTKRKRRHKLIKLEMEKETLHYKLVKPKGSLDNILKTYIPKKLENVEETDKF